MRSATTDTVSSSERIGAVVLCAGKGERTGLEYNKVLYVVGQKTVLETTLDVFARTEVERIVLVISRDDEKAISPLVKPYRNVKTVYGGATRTESVRLGLKALSGCDIVVIHDGARPFVTADTIAASIESAQRFGSGIVAVPTVDTIKQVEAGAIVRSLDRSILYNIQTPQTFRYAEILEAYETASGVYTDDSEVYEKAGYVPHIVRGAYDNIKLTTPADLIKAPTGVRIGVGYDLHRLVNDRPLILGGITVPHRKGLLGHSDADVLIHAVMDAMLSAANLPDIGVLFPDTDGSLEGISSMELLRRVTKLIKFHGYSVGNISAVITAQEPKLAPHIGVICESLAKAMGINVYNINVSATTAEHLGKIGKGKAIAASASCLLTENHDRQTDR